ncbi:MAG TPA: VanZ family protein [Pyrinomonadaceae bacterium]|jgi:VanZ family protein
MKWLTGLYFLLLGVIVFLADQKRYQPLFRRVRELPYGDKLGHLILMGILSFLLNLALSCRTVRVWKLELLKGSLMVALVVTLEEFSQIFIKYRTFDPGDLLSDYLGIFCFGLLAQILTRRKTARAGIN